MFIPWPNSEHTNTYDPPIVYLFSIWRSDAMMFASWFPTAYLMAWIFNIVIFLTELFSWMEGGRFFALWVQVGLWGGLILCALPWVAILLYIYYEWPIRHSNYAWEYIFWSGEFLMLSGQGLWWLASLIVHSMFAYRVVEMVAAREAIEYGLVKECECDPCDVEDGDDEVARA